MRTRAHALLHPYYALDGASDGDLRSRVQRQRATLSRSRYHTTLPSVTERLSVVMAALQARDAVRDTSTRGHGVPRADPFSLPPPLSFSSSRSLRCAIPSSFTLWLVAYRLVGERTVRCFCGAAGRVRSPPTLLLAVLAAHPPNAVLLALPTPRPSSRFIPRYDRRTLGRSRFFVSWRARRTSAALGHRRSFQRRDDTTLAWLLPWRLATDAAGAWDSRSTLIRLHPYGRDHR